MNNHTTNHLLRYKDKTGAISSHTIISKWIEKMPPGSIVLDIGTASGILARMAKERDFIWRGVEMNPDWGNAAEPYYHEFFHGKIEEAPEKIIRQADFIIFADILEHLPDPETILRKIVRNQTSGVLFAISVPNIAHLYMRWQLLLGKFEYTEVGIMDRTHLRFFTRKTFEQMLATCGLIIIEKQTTPIPLDLVNPFFSNFKIGRLIHKMYATLSMKWPTMLGYQFVYLCRLIVDEEEKP